MYSFRHNRVIQDTGAEYPIFQAPIGLLSRAQWCSAISSAGGMGFLETMFINSKQIEHECDLVRAQTNRAFGIHLVVDYLAQKPDHEKDVTDWLFSQPRHFISTTNGDPKRYIERIRDCGAKTYHFVDTYEDALRAEDAGVDGIVLAGSEAGGVHGDNDLHLFALLQKVSARLSIPIVAAGGIVDGRGMAAAFALGAEGVSMGTRFMASTESTLHDGYKEAITGATATLRVNYGTPGIAMSTVRNEFSEAVARGEVDHKNHPYAGNVPKLFFEGRTDQAMVGVGETALLIDSVKSVSDIITDTMQEFWSEIDRLAAIKL